MGIDSTYVTATVTATSAANHESVQLAATLCYLCGFADTTRDRQPNTSGNGSEIAEVQPSGLDMEHARCFC
ncbi:hypothetical protein QTQ03_26935 [Micromonospora sp. WMMA1363]|uniref:hypothetical protein n=1 Tax=Micromonospora sp. WMMA1363 TaxID=3053985 RepID=UPI00259CC7FD|nr:hypothetical protein [Micromonospora sp. WMMA1363]MDM4723060.1 hypothetical protein [Micromonospora sp. WMMA1363]